MSRDKIFLKVCKGSLIPEDGYAEQQLRDKNYKIGDVVSAELSSAEHDRTHDQNAYQWPYLEGFSKQLQWSVNGEKVCMTKEEWKDVLTCAFEKEVNPRLAAGFDSGVVMLGKRTSKFGKKKFAEWMDWLIAAADLKEIQPVFKSGARWPTQPPPDND